MCDLLGSSLAIHLVVLVADRKIRCRLLVLEYKKGNMLKKGKSQIIWKEIKKKHGNTIRTCCVLDGASMSGQGWSAQGFITAPSLLVFPS